MEFSDRTAYLLSATTAAICQLLLWILVGYWAWKGEHLLMLLAIVAANLDSMAFDLWRIHYEVKARR